MSSEVSFASDSMAFRFRWSFFHRWFGLRSAVQVEPEDHDRQDKRQRAEEVEARRDDGNAVVVGVEPEPVGRDRGVVADDHRRRSWRGSPASRLTPHHAAARPGCAVSTTCATIDRRDPEEHEHRDRVHVDEQDVVGSRPATAPRPRRAFRGGAWSRRGPRGSRRASRSPRGTAAPARAAPGYVRNDSKRFSIVIPASTSTDAGEREDRQRLDARCGAGSAGPWRAAPTTGDADARATAHSDRDDRREEVDADAGSVARNRLGSVTMSPAAVTIGAATLSRSRLAVRAERRDRDGEHEHDDRREDRADHRHDHEVDDRDRVGRRRTRPTSTFASTASTADDRQRRARSPRPCSGRPACRSARDRRNVPAWIWVPRRLPSAPKTLPRMPIAAGTSTIRPGQPLEGVGDRAEREAGDEVAARGDQERDEARADPGEVRSARARRSAHRHGAGTRALGNWEVRSAWCLSPEVLRGGQGTAKQTLPRLPRGSSGPSVGNGSTCDSVRAPPSTPHRSAMCAAAAWAGWVRSAPSARVAASSHRVDARHLGRAVVRRLVRA